VIFDAHHNWFGNHFTASVGCYINWYQPFSAKSFDTVSALLLTLMLFKSMSHFILNLNQISRIKYFHGTIFVSTLKQFFLQFDKYVSKNNSSSSLAKIKRILNPNFCLCFAERDLI